MIFDEYYSLQHGPICSSATNGLNGTIDRPIWHKYLKPRSGNLISLVNDIHHNSLDQLSEADEIILRQIWHQFRAMTSSQIRKWTHENCPEYVLVERGRLPIYLDVLAEATGFDNPSELGTIVADYRHSELVMS